MSTATPSSSRRTPSRQPTASSASAAAATASSTTRSTGKRANRTGSSQAVTEQQQQLSVTSPDHQHMVDACSKLLHSILRVSVGAAKFQSGTSEMRPASAAVLEHSAQLQWRRETAHEYASTARFRNGLENMFREENEENEDDDDEHEEAELEDNIENLKERLKESTNSVAVQSTVLHRLQEDAALRALQTEDPTRFQQLMSKFKERDVLALQVLTLNKTLTTLQEQKQSLLKQNAASIIHNRTEFDRLKQAQDSSQRPQSPSKESRDLRKRLDTLRSQNTIIRHVFMGLILESGINWAADDTLRQLMLQLNTGATATATATSSL